MLHMKITEVNIFLVNYGQTFAIIKQTITEFI